MVAVGAAFLFAVGRALARIHLGNVGSTRWAYANGRFLIDVTCRPQDQECRFTVRVSDAGAASRRPGQGPRAGVRKPPKNEPAGQRGAVGRLWGIGRAAALVGDGFAQVGES